MCTPWAGSGVALKQEPLYQFSAWAVEAPVPAHSPGRGLGYMAVALLRWAVRGRGAARDPPTLTLHTCWWKDGERA